MKWTHEIVLQGPPEDGQDGDPIPLPILLHVEEYLSESCALAVKLVSFALGEAKFPPSGGSYISCRPSGPLLPVDRYYYYYLSDLVEDWWAENSVQVWDSYPHPGA